MARKIKAGRYAQAVFEIAREKGDFDKWHSDLQKLARLDEDKTMVALLESPRLGVADKLKVLSARLPDVNPLALNLAQLLAERGGLGVLRHVADEYEDRLNESRGIQKAEVVTAVPIDAQEQAFLAEHLEKLIGKKVIIQPEVNPDIIGGVIIRSSGKLIDGSTRTRLEELKKRMAGTAG